MHKSLPGLTGLRALACLSVIAYHLNQQRTIENLAEWDWNLYQFVETWPVTVSFFFVLGGLLRSTPYWRTVYEDAPAPEAGKALLDRYLRIAPAYYVALAASLLVAYFVQWGMQDALVRALAGFAFVTWIHPATFFPTDLNGPLWYVAYDMMGGLAIIAVMGFVAKLPKKWAWTGLAAGAGTLLAAHFAWLNMPFKVDYGPAVDWYPTYNPFLFGLHFLVGAAFGGLIVKAESRKMRKSYWFDAAFVASLVAVYAFLWDIREAGDFDYAFPAGPYRFPLVPALFGFALFSAAYAKEIGRILDNRPFRTIATLSYSAYLYHALVIALLRQYVFPGFAVMPAQWWTMAAITFPMTFAIAYLSNRYVEMWAVIAYRKATSKRAAS